MIKMALKYFSILILFSVFSIYAEPEKTSTDLAANKITNTTIFARVDGNTISEQEFNASFYQHLQSRFYHGKPPESQVEEVRKEVARSMILRMLLLNEANKQKVSCDQQKIEKTIAQYAERYKSSQQWNANKDSLIPVLQVRLCENDKLKQIENTIRKILQPSESQLHKYYQSNIDKFTEPGRQRISVILLGVAPSASKSNWDAALVEAKSIKLELEQGADFAELASLRSSDKSSQNGGDMGYLHKGMLSAAAEEAIDKLSIGEISEPIRLLEGVALFRVAERKPPRTRTYDDVKQRLQELWARDTSDMAWEKYKNSLWANASIEIYDKNLSARIN